MNGRELSGTTPKERTNLSDETPPLKDDEELRRWAELVAGCLTSSVASRPTCLGFGANETSPAVPDGWRPSVGDLTRGELRSSFSEASAPGVATGSAGSADEVTRIQVRINTREYGELSLVVERAEQGLRVLLGALDARAVSALRQEASAVLRALENGGQTVDCLEIVRMNQVGINLARTRLTPGDRARRSREPEQYASNPSERRKKTRRINLIG